MSLVMGKVFLQTEANEGNEGKKREHLCFEEGLRDRAYHSRRQQGLSRAILRDS